MSAKNEHTNCLSRVSRGENCMVIGAKPFRKATTSITVLLILSTVITAQEPPKPPVAPPKPPPSFWTQQGLTGDWGGARSEMEAKGLEMKFGLTGFVQSLADGGIETGTVGLGKFQTEFKFDLGKLAGMPFWSAEVKTETRFGGPVLGGTGALNPVNTAALVPASAGNVFSITSVNLTKLFPIDLKKGNLFAVSAGRYNLLDLIDEDFFGGRGIDRFMNMAQIGPLTVLREVPIITNAINLLYIRGGEAFITFALLDPNDHSLEPGLKDLYTDGVSFAPAINFPVKYFGKTAKHTFGGAITTKKYTPFDAIRQIIIPGPPINPIEPKRGSWSANYTFRQYLVERGRKDGWGLFGQVAFANPDTSPISKFVNVGIGGNGLFPGRRNDEFGIAYAYTDLSKILKDNLDPLDLRRLRAEHQGEIFYNFHITQWMRLTADLQILRPSRPIAETAIVPGARLEILF